MITLVDAGMANLGSVAEAFRRVGAPVEILDRPDGIDRPEAVVLPGVGTFGDGMASLERGGWTGPLRRWAAEGVPILGICLGMQILAEEGEEHGTHRGLGLVPGRVVRLRPRGRERRVPHIGWCDVRPVRPGALFPGEAEERACYFAHSYHLVCAEPADVSAVIDFDGDAVTAAVERGSLLGVQFHPEKSQDAGLDVLEAFGRRVRAA